MKEQIDFKIRASACGKIMGIKALGKTGESYLQEWLKENLYNRKNEFSTKYTEKGLIMEDNSLDFIADYLGLGLLIKNEQHLTNDYFQGTPDIILSDTVIDVKNSWNCFTFPLFDTEVPNNDYYWQGQVYMNLTGKEKYKLIYTLMDTPEHLIEKEFRWNNFYQLEYEEFREKYLYNDLPAELRIKIFEFDRNQSDIDKIKNRVIECREYLKTLKLNAA